MRIIDLIVFYQIGIISYTNHLSLGLTFITRIFEWIFIVLHFSAFKTTARRRIISTYSLWWSCKIIFRLNVCWKRMLLKILLFARDYDGLRLVLVCLLFILLVYLHIDTIRWVSVSTSITLLYAPWSWFILWTRVITPLNTLIVLVLNPSQAGMLVAR